MRLTSHSFALFLAFLGFSVSWGSIEQRAEVDIEDLKKRTLVIANLASDESMQLANHYVEVRGIPVGNVIYVNTSTKESISWDAFLREIFNPLRIDLVARGWIKAQLGPGEDKQGRVRIRAVSTNIAYLVTTWGIPYKIEEDKERVRRDQNFNTYKWKQTHTGEAALDTELALLAMNGAPIVSLVPNPYHKRAVLREEGDRHIRVSRLDGPSYEIARRVVDDSIYAEEHGLNGRAYVDRGGPYPKGDAWLTRSLKTIRNLHYPVSSNFDEGLAGVEDRFDSLAVYLGWYNAGVGGALKHPHFRFQRGAIAIHIHSYSGKFRSAHSNWSGPLLAKGAAVTIGNVAEPYLDYTQHLDLLMEALAMGWPLGDAMAYSQPSLSWHAMHVGDPLYRPFLYDEESVMASTENEELSASELGLRALRQMNRLKSAGRTKAAIERGKYIFDMSPSVELAIALESEIDLEKELGEGTLDLKAYEVGKGIERAKFFDGAGRPKESVEIIAELLRAPDPLKRGLRRRLWKLGIKYAKSANEKTQLELWNAALKADKEAELETWNAETKRLHESKMKKRKTQIKNE